MTTPQPPSNGLPQPDAHLRQALRHAPDPAGPPAPAVRQAVLAYATKSIAATSGEKAGSTSNPARAPGLWGPWLRRLLGWDDVGVAGWAGATASVMLAVLVGILWSDAARREQAEDVARAPDLPAATPAAVPRTPHEKSQPSGSGTLAEGTPPHQVKADTASRPPARAIAVVETTPPPAKMALASERKRESVVATAPSAQDKTLPPSSASPAQESAVSEIDVPTPQPAKVREAMAPEPPATSAQIGGQLSGLIKDAKSSDSRRRDAASAATLPGAGDGLAGRLSSLAHASMRCRTEPAGTCNTDAARALLLSPLLRRVLAAAQPDTSPDAVVNGAAPNLVLHWYAQGGDAPLASLTWHAGSRRLTWRSTDAFLSTTVSPKDAAALQEPLDSIAVR